jgi:hypothetical protein
LDNGTLYPWRHPEKNSRFDGRVGNGMEMVGTDPYGTVLRYKQVWIFRRSQAVMNKSKIGVRVLLHRARRRLAERIESLAEEDRSGVWIPQRPL